MQQKMLHKSFRYVQGIDETEYSKIAYTRKEKLLLYDRLIDEGCSEETALVAIETPRSTYYRWKKNYKLLGLAGLENASTRPHTARKADRRDKIERRVYQLRIKYPLWGKEKITVMLYREFNITTSISTVGRVLDKLKYQGKIKPVRFFLYGKTDIKRRVFNGHSKRWKVGMKAELPGELIQVDHMTVQVPGLGYLKHFTAMCPITKITVDQVYREATSKNAADFLDQMCKEFPFPIKSIQVDGGGEFMDKFETKCMQQNIDLWVLPPKSPEYNGNVERGNGTMKYEFYYQYDGPINFHMIKDGLQKYVFFYNTIRPHRSIGLLTPWQFYGSIKTEVLQSHMS